MPQYEMCTEVYIYTLLIILAAITDEITAQNTSSILYTWLLSPRENSLSLEIRCELVSHDILKYICDYLNTSMYYDNHLNMYCDNHLNMYCDNHLNMYCDNHLNMYCDNHLNMYCDNHLNMYCDNHLNMYCDNRHGDRAVGFGVL